MTFLDIIDETNKGYTELIHLLCEEFFGITQTSIIESRKVTIKVPLNYAQEFYDNSSAAQQKHIREHGANHQALTVIPTDKESSKFVILLREDVFNGFQPYNTIFHELTHVIDFISYFNDCGNVFIMDEFNKELKYYYEFYFWTEFNAKKEGLKRFKKELSKTGYTIPLEETTKLFIQDISQQSIQFLKLYNLLHFFARLSLFEEGDLSRFDESIFPKKFIYEHFGVSSTDLYDLFRDISYYEKFKLKKYQAKLLIDNILSH